MSSMVDMYEGSRILSAEKWCDQSRGLEDYMKEFISTVSSKGQVTIPAEIRRHLGIETNDKVAFVIDDAGAVRLHILHDSTVVSLQGAAGSLKKPLSWKETQRIAYEDRFDGIIRQEP